METKKDEDLLKQIGSNLLKLRTSAGLKQEQVAHGVGIKQETLSKYENGGIDITISTLAVLAKYFKVDLSAIINIHPNQVFNVTRVTMLLVLYIISTITLMKATDCT